MDQRRTATAVAQNVTDALVDSGETTNSLAEATDTTVSEMDARLAGVVEFTFRELVAVGGFFRVQPESFFKGVQA